MSAQTLKDRAEFIAGVTATDISLSDDMFIEWIADVIIDVRKKAIQVDPKAKDALTKVVELTAAAGTAIKSGDVDGVYREYNTSGDRIVAQKLPEGQAQLASDKTSLGYRSKYNAGWYISNGKIICVPPVSDVTGNKAYAVVVSWDITGADKETVVGDFESDGPMQKYYPALPIALAIKYLDKAWMTLSAPEDLNTSSIAIPQVIEQPMFNIDDASIQHAVTDFSKTFSASAPLFNDPTQNAIQTFEQARSFTEVAPVLSSVDQPISIHDASLSFQNIDTEILPEVDDIVADINSLTYVDYDFSSIPIVLEEWTFNESPDYSGLTIPSVPAALLNDMETKLGTLVDLPDTWMAGADDASGAQNGVDHRTQELDWSTFNSALADDDFDKASAEMTKIDKMATLRQEYHNKNIDRHKQLIEDFKTAIDYSVDKNSASELATYEKQVVKYEKEVGNIFTKWTHDFNRESTKYTNINSQIASKHTSEATQILNKWTSDKAKFDSQKEGLLKRVELKVDLIRKEAELNSDSKKTNAAETLKAATEEWHTKLKRHELSMNKYTQDINTALESYKTNLNRELEAWKVIESNKLARDKDEISKASKQFEASNALWQSSVQKDLAELQGNIESTVSKMDLATNVDLTNKAQKLQKDVQEYSSKMDKYIAEVQTYEKEIGTKIQEHADKSKNIDFKLIQYRDAATTLRAEYNAYFAPAGAIGAPPQKQGDR